MFYRKGHTFVGFSALQVQQGHQLTSLDKKGKKVINYFDRPAIAPIHSIWSCDVPKVWRCIYSWPKTLVFTYTKCIPFGISKMESLYLLLDILKSVTQHLFSNKNSIIHFKDGWWLITLLSCDFLTRTLGGPEGWMTILNDETLTLYSGLWSQPLPNLKAYAKNAWPLLMD